MAIIDPYADYRDKMRYERAPWQHGPRVGSTRFQRQRNDPSYTPGYGASAARNRPGYNVNPFGGPVDVFGGRPLTFQTPKERSKAMNPAPPAMPAPVPAQPGYVPPAPLPTAPQDMLPEAPAVVPPTVPAAPIEPFVSTPKATPSDVANYVSALPTQDLQFNLPGTAVGGGPAYAARTFPQPAPQAPAWHGEIIAKHPEIGQAGTAANQAFVQRFKAEGQDPAKAMEIADATMAQLRQAQAPSVATSDTPRVYLNPYN